MLRDMDILVIGSLGVALITTGFLWLTDEPSQFITSDMYAYQECIEDTGFPKRTCLFSYPEAFVPCPVSSFMTIDIEVGESPVSIKIDGCFISKGGESVINIQKEHPETPTRIQITGGHFFEWRTTPQEGE